MEFCEVALTFESVDEILWCDHSNETSVPVLTHGATCFSKFHKTEFGIFCRILPLVTFGSERVKNKTMWCVDTNLYCHQCSIFIKLKFACLQIFIELLQEERFNMNKRIFVWKKFCHCGITQLLKSNVIIVMVITSGEILDKPRLTWVWYWSRCFFWRTAKLKR